MIDNIAVGKTIAKLRQNRNMTQQQLAAALNVSHQAVSKWENGAAMPDVQTLMNMTRLFGITMEQLLNGDVPEDRISPKSPLEEPLRQVSPLYSRISGQLTENVVILEDNEIAHQLDESVPYQAVTETTANALLLSSFALFEQAGFSGDVYLGVIGNTPRMDTVLQYIDYLTAAAGAVRPEE